MTGLMAWLYSRNTEYTVSGQRMFSAFLVSSSLLVDKQDTQELHHHYSLFWIKFTYLKSTQLGPGSFADVPNAVARELSGP